MAIRGITGTDQSRNNRGTLNSTNNRGTLNSTNNRGTLNITNNKEEAMVYFTEDLFVRRLICSRNDKHERRRPQPHPQ